ncbi:MAG: phytanoyl-CoA dioxygenase family protein [Granulosicoccus sp.]|nr:phytanoyl-CoA dioxygenase family protein [Granulosicoccus sp.]
MLNPSQIQQFEQQGYLVVPNLLSHELLERIKSEYSVRLNDLCRDWFDHGKLESSLEGLSFDEKLTTITRAGLDYFQPLDISWPISDFPTDTPIHLGRAVFDMIRAPALLDAVESLLGPEITSTPIQHVRIKPPLTDVADGENRAHIVGTDWHQDRAVAQPAADQTRMVTVWVAITDATLDNGCLQVIPESHRDAMLTHCPASQLSIPTERFDKNSAAALPVKAGGAVLFHPLTIHGSRDNFSRHYRWSFDLRYNVTGDPTGRQQFPEFVARSRSKPQTEQHDHLQWVEAWMRVKEQLADQPQDPLSYHRWDGTSSVCA